MKTIIKIFICFSIIYTPFFAFAGAAEKWEIVANTYDVAKKTVNVTATKITQDAANSGVYKVQVPVNASTVGSTARMMLKGGIAAVAITGLIESVGWLLEEGSKIYKVVPPDPADPTNAPNLYYSYTKNTYIHLNPQDAVKDFYSKQCESNSSYCSPPSVGACTFYTTGMYMCSATRADGYVGNVPVQFIKNPQYNPNAEPIKVAVSDYELGSEIMGEGTNKTPKTDIITDAYSPNNPVSDAPAPKETNNALESANPQPEAEPKGDTSPKPNNDTDGDGVPDEYSASQPSVGTEFTLPNACEWFPAACEWFSWTKQNDDLPTDEKPEISQLPIPDLKEDAIKWSAQCPADVQVPINLQGVSSTITFSWSPWCQLLAMIKPAIVASAYIGAAFIVLGLRT